jgi:quercetin dioxygenase-like cupin family protein
MRRTIEAVPREGQELEGPNGFRLKLVSLGPDVLVMEATYAAEGPLPPLHLHPTQEERFTVLEGAVRTVVDGEERRYEMGESFVVPAATPHQMAGDGPARTRWEVRPPMRTAEFFEQLYSGQAGAGFLDEFAAEFRLV